MFACLCYFTLRIGRDRKFKFLTRIFGDHVIFKLTQIRNINNARCSRKTKKSPIFPVTEKVDKCIMINYVLHCTVYHER